MGWDIKSLLTLDLILIIGAPSLQGINIGNNDAIYVP